MTKKHSILIKNAEFIATFDSERRLIKHGSIYIEDNRIVAVGSSSEVDYKADIVLDASRKLVLPGLINTHHHLYQNLFRALPRVQNSGLFEWLTELYKLWELMTPEAFIISLKIGIIELLLSGCTTTVDHQYIFVPYSESKTQRLITDIIKTATEQLGIRFHFSRGSLTLSKEKGGLPPESLVESEDTVLKSSKWVIEKFHDPRPYAMIRIVLAPNAPFSVSEELLRETRALATNRYNNVLCHTHIAETVDEEHYCKRVKGMRPLEYMASIGWLGSNVWLAHCIHLSTDEINKLAKTSTGVSYCPSSNLRLGSGIAPVRELLDAGVNVGVGVDGSASNDASNMFAELHIGLLASRARYGASNGLTAMEVLELATIGGATILNRSKELGSIEVGKAADIIGIDLYQVGLAGALHDPLAGIVFCPPYQVDFSIINGKIIVQDGKVKGIELDQLIELQNEYADELVTKAEMITGTKFR